jgi:NitT/TauT family transport system ATP-binding protein
VNETTTPLIQTDLLRMSFESDRDVLSDISLSVARGEFVSLLGPSGCGKSTLLRLIAGLIQPTSGAVRINGQPPQTARRDSTRLAFVFQDPTLLPFRTVRSNIRLPLELEGRVTAETSTRIDETLDLVGLGRTDANKRPAQLSGGMRMRVSLARALITQPDVLLMDEPFAALDDVLRQQLNEELLRICAARKCTTVFVTHNVAEAVFLSHRILVMSSNPGRIRQTITVPFEWPRTSEIRTPEFARTTAEIGLLLREVQT